MDAECVSWDFRRAGIPSAICMIVYMELTGFCFN